MRKPLPVRFGQNWIPALGWAAFAVSERGLVQSAFFFKSPDDALSSLNGFLSSDPHFTVCAEPLVELEYWQNTFFQFFTGGSTAKNPESVPLDCGNWKPFQSDVYLALRDNVHWGETISYGELAMLAGYPGAARAVGTAMAQNSWGPFIPCHRVISARGQLGGYSGCGGLVLKRTLLAMEKEDGATPGFRPQFL